MENTISSKVKRKFKQDNSSTSCIYLLGIIGALIHYISTSTTFVMGVSCVLKSLVWPAVLVYKAFESMT